MGGGCQKIMGNFANKLVTVSPHKLKFVFLHVVFGFDRRTSRFSDQIVRGHNLVVDDKTNFGGD